MKYFLTYVAGLATLPILFLMTYPLWINMYEPEIAEVLVKPYENELYIARVVCLTLLITLACIGFFLVGKNTKKVENEIKI